MGPSRSTLFVVSSFSERYFSSSQHLLAVAAARAEVVFRTLRSKAKKQGQQQVLLYSKQYK